MFPLGKGEYSKQAHVALPEGTFEVSFGKARVCTQGDDVTIVGVSNMLVECLRKISLALGGQRVFAGIQVLKEKPAILAGGHGTKIVASRAATTSRLRASPFATHGGAAGGSAAISRCRSLT